MAIANDIFLNVCWTLEFNTPFEKHVYFVHAFILIHLFRPKRKVGKVSTNFAAAKNGKVGSNFSAAKNGQVSSNSKKR